MKDIELICHQTPVHTVKHKHTPQHRDIRLVHPLTFVEVDHEIIFKVILPLPLIQEEQLSVAGESVCIGTG